MGAAFNGFFDALADLRLHPFQSVNPLKSPLWRVLAAIIPLKEKSGTHP
jgi:hypothetical protein